MSDPREIVDYTNQCDKRIYTQCSVCLWHSQEYNCPHCKHILGQKDEYGTRVRARLNYTHRNGWRGFGQAWYSEEELNSIDRYDMYGEWKPSDFVFCAITILSIIMGFLAIFLS